MTKYYHMIIALNKDTNIRTTYISKKQGYAPVGWTCIAVCGYHERSEA